MGGIMNPSIKTGDAITVCYRFLIVSGTNAADDGLVFVRHPFMLCTFDTCMTDLRPTNYNQGLPHLAWSLYIYGVSPSTFCESGVY